MTELGEAKRRSTNTEEDTDSVAQWSLSFEQIKDRILIPFLENFELFSKNRQKTILFDETSIYNFFQKTVDIDAESRRILSSLTSNEKR